ncbi:MAG: hypothetical protein NE328_23955 [Lentisphaeraceae bacterium]|nr:hypothetical protein [Lentisphaeraceae bacterium]
MKAGKFALVNYGGSYQLDIRTAVDLEALELMDEAFWMSTSAPVFGLNCDPDLLQLLDTNKNGRILSSDIRVAVAKLLKNLKTKENIDNRSELLGVEDIDDSHDSGKLVKDSIIEVLRNLNKPADHKLSLKELRDHTAILCNGLTNGDGIIPPNRVEDKEVKLLIEDIMQCLGCHDDVNGNPGIGAEKLKQFLELSKKYISWKDSGEFNPEILPLHENTAEAFEVFSSITSKIDEYFKLCELQKFNKDIKRIQKEPESPPQIYQSSENIDEYLKNSPLAPVSENAILKLTEPINPYFKNQLTKLQEQVLDEFLARPVMEVYKVDWLKVCDIFKPFENWLLSSNGIEVKSVDEARLRQYLDSDIPAKLQKMIDADKALGKKLKVRQELEEIIILQKNIIDFCNNFVSFPQLYNPEHRAIFEIGYLVIDGRIFNFNLPVEDVKEHSEAAKKSGIYLLYLEITGSKEDKPFFVCTPVTSRKIGLLDVNKRGVLFDLDGKEWDAKVIKVVHNPVSLTEAITAPFRKVSRMLMEAIDKISSETEKELENKLNKASTNLHKDVAKTVANTKADSKHPSSTVRDLMMTGSLTFAALGSSFAYISSTFAKLEWDQGMFAIAIAIIVITLPIVIVSSFKLHRRNMSSILEASGWAINARMRLTRRLAALLAPHPDKPGRVFKKKRDLLKGFSRKFKFRLKADRHKDS